MKKLMGIVLVALLAWNMDTAFAQKPGVVLTDEPGWQKIGETVASFKSQNESIAVIGADEFSAIKIKVEDAPLEIERLQVFYESGDMEEIDVSKKIEPGDESDVFRLEHPDRDIQKVAFTYNTAANQEGDKAAVELYGLNPDQPEDRSSDAYRNDAQQTADDIERKADRTADDIERESEDASSDFNNRAERTGRDLEEAADETGDAISETAAKAAAEIDDDRHETKVGPDGQTIYISDDSRYYYINDQGKRVYVSEMQLKDKDENDNR